MKKSKYDGDGIFHFKNGAFDEVVRFFADVESRTAVLLRIEVNAMTHMHFRKFDPRVIEQPSIREAHRGMYGRLWTCEIWQNNLLKDGQLKLFWNKIPQDKSEEEVKSEQQMDGGL